MRQKQSLPLDVIDEIGGAVIKKSNELVTSNIEGMSLKEAQLLALAISKIPKDARLNPKENIRIKIDRREFDLIFQLNGQTIRKIEDLCQKLQTRIIVVRRRNSASNGHLDLGFNRTGVNDDWKRMVIVPTCEYRSRVFSLTLNADLNDHFFMLNDRFTSYNLVNIIGLASHNQIRLYEIMIMIMSRETNEEMSIEQFRSLMDATEKYPRFNNFKQRVINPAVKAINEVTDLKISYQLKHKNKEVVGIKFTPTRREPITIKNDGKPADPQREKDQIEMEEYLVGQGISIVTAQNMLSYLKGGKEDFFLHMEAAEEYIRRLNKSNSNPNVPGILTSAIKEGWIPKNRAKTSAQATLDLSPRDAQQADVLMQKIDILPMIRKIEANASLKDEFLKYLDQRSAHVLLDLIGKQGLKSLHEDRELNEKMINFFKSKDKGLPESQAAEC